MSDLPRFEVEPDPARVAELLREQRALYPIGYAATMDAIEVDGHRQLGIVGWTFVFGRGDGAGVIVHTDRDYSVSKAELMLPIPPAA